MLDVNTLEPGQEVGCWMIAFVTPSEARGWLKLALA